MTLICNVCGAALVSEPSGQLLCLGCGHNHKADWKISFVELPLASCWGEGLRFWLTLGPGARLEPGSNQSLGDFLKEHQAATVLLKNRFINVRFEGGEVHIDRVVELHPAEVLAYY